MTTVPVLWVSARPEIVPRGYHDQGLLEELFARMLWTPPGALEFEHHEVHGKWPKFPDVGGAVVLLPARHHVEQQAWFEDRVRRLSWALIIMCGDEEWDYPWEESYKALTTQAFEEDQRERYRWWYMQPIPAQEKFASQLIPGGWYPRTREWLKGDLWPNRGPIYDWMFAGQVTHVRREEAWEAIKDLPDGYAYATDGYLKGISPEEYFLIMASSKVVPCPSGPEHVDTARTFEALEAGIIPVSDLIKPHEKTCPQFDYWNLLFGYPNPLPKLHDWSTFPDVLEEQLDGWPANANRLFSFWQQWKRQLAHKMDDDIRALAGIERELPTVDDQVTIIISTSPAHLHPSTEHIEIVVNSVREQLPMAEIIIVCDGVRPEDEGLRDKYEEYQRRLFWLTNFHWHNVVPLRMDAFGHQANCVRAALKLVTTPYVLMVEHDTPIKNSTTTEIPWNRFLDGLESGMANVIRLHHEASILESHEETVLPEGKPGFVRSKAWWQRPHLARVDFYRDRVMPNFTETSRAFIEDVMYGKVLNDHADRGDAAWWDWRIYIFAPEGDMQTSWHLDSRGDHPKHPQKFA